jgi:hypothetical protein
LRIFYSRIYEEVGNLWSSTQPVKSGKLKPTDINTEIFVLRQVISRMKDLKNIIDENKSNENSEYDHFKLDKTKSYIEKALNIMENICRIENSYFTSTLIQVFNDIDHESMDKTKSILLRLLTSNSFLNHIYNQASVEELQRVFSQPNLNSDHYNCYNKSDTFSYGFCDYFLTDFIPILINDIVSGRVCHQIIPKPVILDHIAFDTEDYKIAKASRENQKSDEEILPHISNHSSVDSFLAHKEVFELWNQDMRAKGERGLRASVSHLRR